MSIPGRRIDADGLGLNVAVDGAGPDVVLLHGFPDTNAVWRHQIPALVAAGFRVIAPDLRGYGGSDIAPRTRDYRLDRLVADLVAVLDALDAPTVRLVGHDWGAVVGWLACGGYPDRIDRFAALSVGHPAAYLAGGIGQVAKGWYVLGFQAPVVPEALLSWHGGRLAERLMAHDGPDPGWRTDLSRPGRLAAALNLYRANARHLLTARTGPVSVPVLGVWGEGDVALTERQMTASRRHVSGPWRYERVDGGGHWLQLARPAQLNALLVDFLG